jgi:hypothetical protein
MEKSTNPIRGILLMVKEKLWRLRRMPSNHLILEGSKTTKLDEYTESTECFFRYEVLDNDKAFAATILTEVVLHELGDGDGENENHGSLKNCRGDIWNCLYHHGHYSYANLTFAIKEINFFN